MRQQIKKILDELLKNVGYELSRIGVKPMPGSVARPVGNMQFFLEDIRDRGFTPTAILDVGANNTSWSKIAKEVFPQADCFMIEPQIEMKPFLDSFCENFPGSKYFLAGAGAIAGELILNIWDDFSGSSLIAPESTQSKRVVEQRRIPIVTIDSLIENGNLPLPDLVKLDIQGFEIEALQGGLKLLENAEILILEVSLLRFKQGMPIFHEVIDFMANKNYLVYDFPGFLRRPYDGSLGQIDICFAKENGCLRKHHYWSS